jgi:hypothetical protein
LLESLEDADVGESLQPSAAEYQCYACTHDRIDVAKLGAMLGASGWSGLGSEKGSDLDRLYNTIYASRDVESIAVCVSGQRPMGSDEPGAVGERRTVRDRPGGQLQGDADSGNDIAGTVGYPQHDGVR